VNPLSLTYDILELPFNKETVESVRDNFGSDIGKASVYPVYISLKTSYGWTGPQRMIYDTGAVISILPFSYYDILGLEKYAKARLTGVDPQSHIYVRMVKVGFKFVDLQGKASDEFQAWFGIAERDDVPRIIGLKDVNLTHKFSVDAKNGIFRLEF